MDAVIVLEIRRVAEPVHRGPERHGSIRPERDRPARPRGGPIGNQLDLHACLFGNRTDDVRQRCRSIIQANHRRFGEQSRFDLDDQRGGAGANFRVFQVVRGAAQGGQGGAAEPFQNHGGLLTFREAGRSQLADDAKGVDVGSLPEKPTQHQARRRHLSHLPQHSAIPPPPTWSRKDTGTATIGRDILS